MFFGRDITKSIITEARLQDNFNRFLGLLGDAGVSLENNWWEQGGRLGKALKIMSFDWEIHHFQ